MHSKMVIVLTVQETEEIKSVVTYNNKTEALRILEQLLLDKIEAVHKAKMVRGMP